MVFKRWQIIAGIALFVLSTVASALSLGRVRGTALLGRSLDLSIQSALEINEALPDGNCLTAEVFYGDTKVSPSAVNVIPERTSGGELRIRIRASTVVDEPVVTLFLRSTCGGTVSRRYVLLAELLTDTETNGAVMVAPLSPAVSLASPRIAFGGATSSLLGAASSELTSNKAVARRAERVEQRRQRREARQQRPTDAGALSAREALLSSKDRTTPSVSVVRKTVAASAPRLKIDLLDLTAVEPSLRGSAELSSAPSGDEAVRRQAQALWRMLNASPEDALRDAQRLETLEIQMRTTLDQSKRQGQDIATLSTELQVAQNARYVNPFTIFLVVLTLAAMASSLLLWKRSRSLLGDKPWWGGNTGKREPKDEQHLWKHLSDGNDSAMQPLQRQTNSSFSPNATSPGMPSRGNVSSGNTSEEFTRPGVLAGKGSQGPLRFVEKASAPIDFKASAQEVSLSSAKIQPLGSSLLSGRGGSMGPVDSTPPPPFMQSPRASKAGFAQSDFAPSSFSSPRVVAAEELFDIQEQADFFLSLDQPDQAIEVLKNHITDNVETSALAYMDLFDIYHRTNRSTDYSELREQFNHVFNAQVPEFAKYGAQSRGLEDFPRVLGNIQASWSRPQQAQDVIEESIFRHPDQDHQILDMAAYRELMLLYALAKELSRPDAAYSMLPISTQSPIVPGLLGALDEDSANIDLGDGLIFSSPTDDLLSPDDRTVSLPHPLLKVSASRPYDDGSLDFDLSDSAALTFAKPSGSKK